MKKPLFLLTIPALILFLANAGCNRCSRSLQEDSTATKDATVPSEVAETEMIKDQVIEVIQNAPRPVDITDLFEEAGASYISELTVPPEDVEKMGTTIQKAFGIGLYGFDCKYASVYNRADLFLETKMIVDRLITELGVQGLVEGWEKYVERIKSNQTNEDSLRYLVGQIFDHFHEYMQEGENADLYAHMVLGANIEALYALSQLTLLAENKEKLLELVNNRDEQINTVSRLLAIISKNESAKPYFEKITPVVQFFEENQSITRENLPVVAGLIETARNSMIEL